MKRSNPRAVSISIFQFLSSILFSTAVSSHFLSLSRENQNSHCTLFPLLIIIQLPKTTSQIQFQHRERVCKRRFTQRSSINPDFLGFNADCLSSFEFQFNRLHHLLITLHHSHFTLQLPGTFSQFPLNFTRVSQFQD